MTCCVNSEFPLRLGRLQAASQYLLIDSWSRVKHTRDMVRPIRSVVVLGANGAMGAGSGAVFAAAGIPTVFLARTKEKAEAGRARAESMVKSTAIGCSPTSPMATKVLARSNGILPS